jgi:hypothetical protein
MKVICIAGQAEAGKDTCANILKEKLESQGKKCLIVHYADLLKFYARQYFGWSGTKDNEGRTLLQKLGTDIVRTRDPDYWVNAVASFIYLFQKDFDFFLIPDTRFPNECNCMSENFDTITLKVERPDHQNNLTPEQRLHPSETALNNFIFDCTIITEEGLDNLAIHIGEFIQHFSLN